MKGFAKGFTLIEVAIYTALSAVISTLMIGIFLSVSQAYQRESASAEVTGQLTFVTQTFGRLIRDASNIEMATSTATSTLKLRMQDTVKDPTCISLVNGTIKLAEGPDQANANNCNSITSDLTNTRVTVDALNFKKTSYYPGHDTVSYDVQMTYKSSSPKAQVQRKLSSAIARVSAATFDADLLPGSSYNYTIGQYQVPWKNIYMADGAIGSPSYTFSNDTNLGISKVSGTSTMAFSTQGLERMRISANGNIGIGTTGPLVPLHVAGSASSPATSGTTPNGIIAISNGNTFTTLYGGAYSASPYAFWLQAAERNALGSYDALVLNPNAGNVGIGTTNPGAKLEVAGASNVFSRFDFTSTRGVLRLFNNSMALANTTDLGIDFTPSTGNPFAGIYSGWQESTSDGFLAFKTSNNGGTTLSERVRITSAGNVGIGTTGPSTKLDVIGTVKADLLSITSVNPIYLPTIQGDSGTTLIVRSDGYVNKLVSSARYKDNIRDWSLDTNKQNLFLSLSPKMFDYKNNGTKNVVNFIAEDANATGLPSLVNYDSNGLPESLRDYTFISMQHLVLQNHEERIKILESNIEALKTENESLKNRIEILEMR